MALLSAAALPAWGAAAAPSACSVKILDRYGGELRVFTSGAREYCEPVTLDRVSPWLVLATLAAEDKRFFDHSGVDARAALRALWQNARAGATVSGASTITQQLARALEPHEKTFFAKLGEMWAAVRLERKKSKREILEEYFNAVSYANSAKGAQSASELYFGAAADSLSPAQAALLAGIPKSPRKYNPLRHPDNAARRQRIVLRRMLDAGYLDEELYHRALAEKTVIRHAQKPFAAPQFSLYALRRAREGDCAVKTAIDPVLQEHFQRLLRAHVARLAASSATNGALVALDNRTGEVLAWAGSADFSDAENGGQIDGVTALRQPGSALKPFVYALAVSKGWKTTDRLDDSPAFFSGGFAPKNYDETFHGKVSLREALACSYNVPAVRVAAALGADRVLALLNDFGFTSLKGSAEKYGLGISLGDGEVTLLELAAAYSSLARGGVRLEPRFTMDGPPPRGLRVLDRQSAYIITHILSDNHARARAFTLNSPFNLPFAFAAKTGTSKDYRDNWAVGYTPDWTVAAWTGNFSGKPMRRVSGITGAGPMLGDAAAFLYSKRPSGGFPVPPGVKFVEICPESGKLPGPYCPAAALEVFNSKYLPSENCDIHIPPQPAAAKPAKQGLRPIVDFPKKGDVFKIDPSAPRAAQALVFRAQNLPGGATLQWMVDSKPAAGGIWQLKAGEHRAQVSLEKEGGVLRSRAVKFTVLE
ncbi:MAG: penicillin-binding protein 1C [Elusimicrobiales bacterium]|nr:penicillin-binding protein 1C [Elusimicrobiales bacterium]